LHGDNCESAPANAGFDPNGGNGMKRRILFAGIILLLAWPVFASAGDKFSLPVSASSKVLGYAPLWAADKKGFFDREGLDVQVTVTQGTSPSMQALVAESVHVALSANDGPIGLIEKGVHLAMIAGGSKTTHMIMGGKNIKTFEDLRGATIGSSTLTSGTAFLLRRVLKAKGLEYPRDYSLVNVGGSGPVLMALSAGKVDAGILAVPLNFKAEQLGLNLVGKVTDVFPNYLLSSFSVQREWAAAHHKEVIKFLKGLLHARRWLEENREEAVSFLADDLKLKPALARKGLEYYLEHRAWEPDLSIDLDGLKAVIEVYAEQAGMVGPPPPPAKYVDLTYLHEALNELGWR
jgi:ABC-type nitrate/sulfonate/bicarbonate transport system substrate-binding protein